MKNMFFVLLCVFVAQKLNYDWKLIWGDTDNTFSWKETISTFAYDAWSTRKSLHKHVRIEKYSKMFIAFL